MLDKIGDAAKAGDKLSDAAKAGDKLSDAAKAGDKLSDAAKAGDKLSDAAKAGDKLSDAAKAGDKASDAAKVGGGKSTLAGVEVAPDATVTVKVPDGVEPPKPSKVEPPKVKPDVDGTKPPKSNSEKPPLHGHNSSDTKKNLEDFKNGSKRFDEVLDDYASEYSTKIDSNKPWTWRDIEGGESLTRKQKAQIKQQAIDLGLIPEVPMKPGTNSADFESIGVVKVTKMLPEDMWKSGYKEHFKWLDEQIGGRPDGYTWHHSGVPGKMELVPYGIHNATWHKGGMAPGGWASVK